MNSNRHPNLEICDALYKLPDGSYSCHDMEIQQRLPWRDDVYPHNAPPDRVKQCCLCYQNLPIAEFLIEGRPARSIVRGDTALIVADVRLWCNLCDLIVEGMKHA